MPVPHMCAVYDSRGGASRGKPHTRRRRGSSTGPSTLAGVNRRILTLLVALVPIVAFGLLLAVVTVPYVSLGPGPTFDTL
ncbi:MAG: conserved secreted protein, partial [Mycobacterium sp.]|nr:conserved secreted protein [Mycobacterium sp.]